MKLSGNETYRAGADLDEILASVSDSVENKVEEILKRLLLLVCARGRVLLHTRLRGVHFPERTMYFCAIEPTDDSLNPRIPKPSCIS